MIEGQVSCEIKEAETEESSGVEDGGSHELYCEVCNTHQLTIMCTRPSLDFDASYKAKCYKCGNFSNQVEIHGGTTFIFPGNDTKRHCFMKDFKIVNGTTILNMQKG
jgi:hypothetical protein